MDAELFRGSLKRVQRCRHQPRKSDTRKNKRAKPRCYRIWPFGASLPALDRQVKGQQWSPEVSQADFFEEEAALVVVVTALTVALVAAATLASAISVACFTALEKLS